MCLKCKPTIHKCIKYQSIFMSIGPIYLLTMNNVQYIVTNARAKP